MAESNDDEQAVAPTSAEQAGEAASETSEPAEAERRGAPKAERPEGAKEPQEDESRGSGVLVGVLGFLLALGVGFFVGQWIRDDGASVEIERGLRYSVDLRGDEPQVGPDDALVTIVEFADYQCPYCAKAKQPLMEAVARFEGDVRVIYKHLPLPGHTAAGPAAQAAWAAHQQGKFWEMHDFLFQSNANAEASVAQAERLGLDVARYEADRNGAKAKEAVDDDLRAGKLLGVRGTPAFFVNGHPYTGLRTRAQWVEIIEAELGEAKDLVSAGTPRAGVYDRLMEGAQTKKRTSLAEASAAAAIPETVHAVPVDDRPALGPDDALVTVVVWSDFQCPYCARMQPIVHALAERHDDVRVVFRNFPLPSHPRAALAAKVALAAARQGKFWEMHDALFEAQPRLGTIAFEELAGQVGLDLERFAQDLEDAELEALVAEDEALARRLELGSTPSAFINGRYLRGAQPLEIFEQVIAQERDKARSLVAEGVAPAEVYDRVIAAGRAKVAGG